MGIPIFIAVLFKRKMNTNFNVSGLSPNVPSTLNHDLLNSTIRLENQEIEKGGFWFEGMPVTFSTFLESLARRYNVSFLKHMRANFR